MLGELNKSARFQAFYTASKVGKTGLTVTVDVYSPSGIKIINGGSATEVAGGYYTYLLAAASVTTVGYFCAVFKTSDATVDTQELPAVWYVGLSWVQVMSGDCSSLPNWIRALAVPDNSAAAVQARAEINVNVTGVAALNVTENLNNGLALLAQCETEVADGFGTSTLGDVEAAISALVPGLTTEQAEALAAAVSGVGDLVTRITAERAANLDNLDAAVSGVGGISEEQAAALAESIATALSATVASSEQVELLAAAVVGLAGQLTGSGDVMVDEDTGGADNLAFKTGAGAGIGAATVRAYVASEWTASPSTAAKRGETVTNDAGGFVLPLWLNDGVPYTITYAKKGYRLATKAVTP